MKKIISNPAFTYFLGLITFPVFMFTVNYYNANNAAAKRERLFAEAQRILEAERNTELNQADRYAQNGIEGVFYSDPATMRIMGLIFDANLAPDYQDLIKQMQNMKKHISSNSLRVNIMDTFGYDYGKSLWYVLEHYDEWQRSKQ